MKLVNPGIGEISDRLTILTLKILIGVEQGKETTHWETERAALLVQIRARTLNAIWFEALLELAGINALIWHNEDDLRILRQRWMNWERSDSSGLTGSEERKRIEIEAGSVGFRSQRLNDRRAELVQQINKDAGDAVAQEK
jgi:hypothetical protein